MITVVETRFVKVENVEYGCLTCRIAFAISGHQENGQRVLKLGQPLYVILRANESELRVVEGHFRR